jgi:hypothetical protein
MSLMKDGIVQAGRVSRAAAVLLGCSGDLDTLSAFARLVLLRLVQRLAGEYCGAATYVA